MATPQELIKDALSRAAGSWHLGPLAAAGGKVRSHIVDAVLGFDAIVTVPIKFGQVDFDDVTVEHVGPDSRMGISPLGVYVDAPNGRTYVFQFSTPPVGGVEFEKRGALLGPLISDRGKLRLKEFVEGLLRAEAGAGASGLTEQSRQLLVRTSVEGELRLADAKFAGMGVKAELDGAAQDRNVVRVRSDSVARGVTLEIASLSLRNVAVEAAGREMRCAQVSGSVSVRLWMEGGSTMRIESDVENLNISGVSF